VTIIMVEHRLEWDRGSCAAQFRSWPMDASSRAHHERVEGKIARCSKRIWEQHHERRHRTGTGDSGQARLEVPETLRRILGGRTFSSTSLRPFRAAA